MARERMAKLLKYGYLEPISCHIMGYFIISQNFIIIMRIWARVISAPRLQMNIWNS